MTRGVGPDDAERVGFEPPLPYRITGRLNELLWRIPLPQEVLVRLSALIYHGPPMPGELVVKVVETLRAAGVRCWISGGWGIDALLGTQSRKHEDLDIVIDEIAVSRAVRAVEELGFSRWFEVDSERPLFSRIVLRDHPVAGHAVDLQPLDISSGQVEFTTGQIEDRPVQCLALSSQLTTHSNYRNANCRKRRRDLADMALLRGLARRSAPSPGSFSDSAHQA